MRLVKATVCLDYSTDFLEFWILGNYLFKPDSIEKIQLIKFYDAHLIIALILIRPELKHLCEAFISLHTNYYRHMYVMVKNMAWNFFDTFMWKSSYIIYCFTETCSYVCASNFINNGLILMCFTPFESSWSPLSDANVKFYILNQCCTLSWFNVEVDDVNSIPYPQIW